MTGALALQSCMPACADEIRGKVSSSNWEKERQKEWNGPPEQCDRIGDRGTRPGLLMGCIPQPTEMFEKRGGGKSGSCGCIHCQCRKNKVSGECR